MDTVTSATTPEPVRDLAALPLVLFIPDMVRIVRRAVGTIRRDCQRGTFRPAPFGRRPYRWLRTDVIAYFDALSDQAARAIPPAAPLPLQPTRRRRVRE